MKKRQTRSEDLLRSHFLNPIFGAALEEFGVKFKATASIMHRGNKGNEREEVLRKFFRDRLP
jgi:hypothetical protein